MNTSMITVVEVSDDLRGLADRLDVDLDGVEITEESSLEYDLEMDSLNLMDFLVFLEKKYGVRISDDRLGDVSTVGDVVKLINDLVS
jgi:acyl carrier protein